MSTAEIKQKLHEYIDTAEDKKIKAIYTLLENEMSDEFTYTDEQKKELDRRYDDYMNGVGKTYTWEQTVMLTNKALKSLKE